MEAELHQHHASLLCCRFEDEINRRTAAENEFVVLKKVRGQTGRVGDTVETEGPGDHMPLTKATNRNLGQSLAGSIRGK